MICWLAANVFTIIAIVLFLIPNTVSLSFIRVLVRVLYIDPPQKSINMKLFVDNLKARH